MMNGCFFAVVDFYGCAFVCQVFYNRGCDCSCHTTYILKQMQVLSNCYSAILTHLTYNTVRILKGFYLVNIILEYTLRTSSLTNHIIYRNFFDTKVILKIKLAEVNYLFIFYFKKFPKI